MLTRTLKPESPSSNQEAHLIPLGLPDFRSHVIGEFFTLGRDTDNLISLTDGFVSGHHARIERRADRWMLLDLKSTNGTFLNGVQVTEAYLADGDTFRIGSREFHFHVGAPETGISDRALRSKNPVWCRQLATLPVFSQTELPVLLLGPSGTGKEVLAGLIHEKSKRASGPFVSVNCSALSESLVESELFGHIKGSFTGALADRKGAFESARGGTLFLDEIGDLPLNLQPKLLRALENREIRPVGSDRTVSTDVRIVSATHQSLQTKIVEGRFRADLFYRLNVVTMNIPSLMKRPEDFEDLLFLFAREMHVSFSHAAIQELKKHAWPGNIRELRNAVARASAIFSGHRIQPEDVPLLYDELTVISPSSIPMNERVPLNRSLPIIKELEKEMIRTRLTVNRGNQRQTAQDLHMPKSTLHDRIKMYKIDLAEFRPLRFEEPEKEENQGL